LPILSSVSGAHALSGLTAGDAKKFGSWEARIWPSDADGHLEPSAYPEIAMGLKDASGTKLEDRPNIGLCFSGGGSRASTAGFGIMRALTKLKDISGNPLIDSFRYTSGVSGGNWFLKAYTFSPVPDEEFFGSHIAPIPVNVDDNTSLADLHFSREEDLMRIRHSLFNVADGNPFEKLAAISEDALFLKGSSNNSYWFWWIADGIVSEITDYLATNDSILNRDETQVTRSDEAWTRQSCGPILAPLGLYGVQNGNDVSNTLFTWNAQTLADILQRNKQLSGSDFFLVTQKRPFSIMGVSAMENPHGTLSALGLGLEAMFLLMIEGETFSDNQPPGVLSQGFNISQRMIDEAKANYPWLGDTVPIDWLSGPSVLKDACQIEVTPLYIGNAAKVNNIGGGFVESFAGDRGYVRDAGANTVIVRGNLPEHQNLTIADTMGMASTAIGLGDISRVTAKWDRIFPNANSSDVWWIDALLGEEGIDFGTQELTHIPTQNRTSSRTVNAMDGGYLENLAIFPLLRRRVSKILCCDMRGGPTHERRKYHAKNYGTPSTASPQSLDLSFDQSGLTEKYNVHGTDQNYYDGTYTPDDDLKNDQSLDDATFHTGNAVSHLFGVHRNKTHPAFMLGRYKNQVFDNSPVVPGGLTPYEQLQEDMAVNYERYGIAFCRGTYTVLRNPNYGINLNETPYTVEVFWYFLDSSPVWSTAISEILEWLRTNDVPLPQRPLDIPGAQYAQDRKMKNLKRSLSRFPNLATPRINLTDYESALMGNYGEWAFRKIEAHLRSFLFD